MHIYNFLNVFSTFFKRTAILVIAETLFVRKVSISSRGDTTCPKCRIPQRRQIWPRPASLLFRNDES